MIILNMEMPPNCFDCRLAVSDWERCGALAEEVREFFECDLDNRPKWCPLVECKSNGGTEPMILYFYPYADVVDKDGKEFTQSTYDGFTDISSAINQFGVWEQEYGYKITDARIEIRDNKGNVSEIIHYEKKWVPKDDD